MPLRHLSQLCCFPSNSSLALRLHSSTAVGHQLARANTLAVRARSPPSLLACYFLHARLSYLHRLLFLFELLPTLANPNATISFPWHAKTYVSSLSWID
ncbi:unnamed protein product [Triticum turgidum subsp. durum]|uniref:Uncharacterized protein n=1 Tax=Triticum turgidum subsp. durum TaxID=4567 RepID=A0A9R1QVZ6_TRITD|nr:unnamed protein product [Triticum turgidum subsp. durum]